jgi:type II secretory pathway pseudopilin PulG
MDTTPQSTPGMEPRTDGKAIGSLVCGLLAIPLFWLLVGIPAIILGHMSRSSIRKSMGRLTGEGIALTGLILGYLSVALLPVVLILAVIAIPSWLRSRQVANESAAIRNLRTITVAEANLESSNGRYGDLQALISARLVDQSFITGPKAGYYFRIETSGDDYTATATPATSNNGRYGYSSTSDTIIRYSREPALAPPDRAGEPVE